MLVFRHLCVLGAGSWGTALAIALSPRFSKVSLWCHNPERARELQEARENRRYLPGFALPANVCVSSNARNLLGDAELVLLVLPSHTLRSTLEPLRHEISPAVRLVSATKGLETGTLLRMSQVVSQLLRRDDVVVLSGPTYAREVAAGEPTAVVVACDAIDRAEELQHALSTAHLRFYASSDPIGVEIGAALKNVIAIGAGICTGLGLGNNSVAALVTRGLAEITRLAVRLGADSQTLSGLAGLGDLVLTTTGDLSRNRHVGFELGRGRALPEILAGMVMVAEGVPTCRAARDLAVRENVCAPIIEQMFHVLYEAKDPRIAIRELMDRPLTLEYAGSCCGK